MYADHLLCNVGRGFTNHSSQFFDIKDNYSNIFTHGAPFKGFVYDSSVSGANVMSGVYIDGSFTTKGNNNYLDVNFNEGQVYFDANQGNSLISGDYAIKEYNVQLTSFTEKDLLFEKKFELAPQTSINTANTGLAPNSLTYPAIYILSRNLKNEEFAFGGLENTMYGLRLMVFSDNLFSIDAVNSVFVDKVRTNIPILEESDFPFNAYGGIISDFNYTGLSASKSPSQQAWIQDVRVNPISNTQIQTNNTEIFASIIDIDLHKYRYSRQE